MIKNIRIFGCFFCFFLLFPVKLSFAQYVPPGWFVMEGGSAENISDTPKNLEQKNQTVEDERPVKKSTTTLKKRIVKNKKEGRGAAQEIYSDFAGNNQGVRLASMLFNYEKTQNFQNFALSPLIFYVSSLMLANGVVDEALLEFSKIFSVLRLNMINQRVNSYLMQKRDYAAVDISLWGNVFSRHYRQIVKDFLNAEVWSLENKLDTANGWAFEKTNGEVKEAFFDKTVNPDELYVIGIASFNVALPIDNAATKVKVFKNADGSMGEIPMMYGRVAADYYEDAVMQVVAVSYGKNDRITLYLPKEGADLEKFAANIGSYRLRPRFEKQVMIDLFVPKFEVISTKRDVKSLYQLFGVGRIFELTRDFAKMIDFDTYAHLAKATFITKVIVSGQDNAEDAKQNQESAATDFVRQFVADRPFFFMINEGDCIGFFGQADALKAEKILQYQKQRTAEVKVKERKDGDPAWYEGHVGGRRSGF